MVGTRSSSQIRKKQEEKVLPVVKRVTGRKNTRRSSAVADEEPEPVKKVTRRKKVKKTASSDSECDEEALRVKEKFKRKKQAKKTKTGDPFVDGLDLDALLDQEISLKQKHEERSARLDELRMSNEEEASLMTEYNEKLAENVKLLQTDGHLFNSDLSRKDLSNETYGFVFQPIQEPLEPPIFKATDEQRNGPLGSLYECMEATEELDELLWGKLIILRLLAEARKKSSNQFCECPHDIIIWLFDLVSSHPDSHIVRGAFLNILALLRRKQSYHFTSDIPNASMVDLQFDPHKDLPMTRIVTDWFPKLTDFLAAFRKYGFKDGKRGMSAKNKTKGSKSTESANAAFPILNMEYILSILILCIRNGMAKIDSYDAFQFTMFFLRLQFEKQIPFRIKNLGSIAIEQMLDQFDVVEWRTECACLCKRIVGTREGIFNNPRDWLTVARRIPNTKRGVQLTAMLAVYALQHQPALKFKSMEIPENQPEPMRLPLKRDLVMDIVANVVDAMTENSGCENPNYELMCLVVLLIDLAMQAFLSKLIASQTTAILNKLDRLTTTRRETMSSRWYELKTITGMLRRKYVFQTNQHIHSGVPISIN